MLLWILAYIGGLLTILSPCILPVLPFVFSSSDGRAFRKESLPLLAGMAATFSLVSTLAVVGGQWATHANEWGRIFALGFLTLVAFSLLLPSFAEKLTHPITRFGDRLGQGTTQSAVQKTFLKSFILGIATGLLWAPCAGPILGLILAGAAIQGASVGTSFLLLAYALGAATSLALALAAGGKLLKSMKKYLGADLWVRRTLGSLVLLGVLAIALGWDRGILTRLSRVHTDDLEQKLVSLTSSEKSAPKPEVFLDDEGPLPDLSGAVQWLNSPPLTREALRGKIILIDFWTYSCINCLRSLPYVEAWAQKYKDQGLVVIGVHSPEFAFEKSSENVQKAVKDLGVTYPVALDNDFKIWNAFANRYWPAHYFIDAKGVIRHHHFGEGSYDQSEKVIQALIAERDGKPLLAENPAANSPPLESKDIRAPSLSAEVRSPETYLGSERAQGFVEEAQKKPNNELALNHWTIRGDWKISDENISLTREPGAIRFRFHARDLHLVMGPAVPGKTVRFRVRIDGREPAESAGQDVDAHGDGIVREQRLYQLIRQSSQTPIIDHTFEIEFLEPGINAFAFTFG